MHHSITTTALPISILLKNRRLHKLSYQFALGEKKKTKRNSQCCKTDKRTMRMMLSAYEKMIHKRCDDYICT